MCSSILRCGFASVPTSFERQNAQHRCYTWFADQVLVHNNGYQATKPEHLNRYDFAGHNCLRLTIVNRRLSPDPC